VIRAETLLRRQSARLLLHDGHDECCELDVGHGRPQPRHAHRPNGVRGGPDALSSPTRSRRYSADGYGVDRVDQRAAGVESRHAADPACLNIHGAAPFAQYCTRGFFDEKQVYVGGG